MYFSQPEIRASKVYPDQHARLLFMCSVLADGVYMSLWLIMLHSGCILQEVLLKRAADLVEALYGMPHNNQVQTHANEAPFLFLCTVAVIKSALVSFCYIPVCFKACWGPLYCGCVKACFLQLLLLFCNLIRGCGSWWRVNHSKHMHTAIYRLI